MNKKKFVLITITAFFILETALFSQNDKNQQLDTSMTRFSLNDAQTFAVKFSYASKSSKLDVQSAKKKVWETTSIGLPQVNGKISYQNILKVPEISFGPALNPGNLPQSGYITANDLTNAYVNAPPMPLGVKENITWSVTLSQLIFSGEYIVGLQGTKVFYELTAENDKKTERDTKESVSKTYFMALAMEENFRILKSGLELVDKTLNEISAMYKQGLIEETDVDQLKITRSTLETSVNAIDRTREISKRLLKFQMGIDINKQIVLTDSLSNILVKSNVENYVFDGFNLLNNNDYKIMQANEAGQLLFMRREKSRYLPTVAAFYSHQELFKKPTFNFTPPDVIGLSVDIPIFSSFGRNSRVIQSRYTYEKAVIAKNQVAEGLLLSYEQNKSDLLTAIAKFKTVKENVDLSKKVYDRTVIKFKSGTASSLELTQAQNQYLTTQSNYFNSIVEMLNAKTSLDKLLNK